MYYDCNTVKDAGRKWKNIKTKKSKLKYMHLNNELREENEKPQEQWLKDPCDIL